MILSACIFFYLCFGVLATAAQFGKYPDMAESVINTSQSFRENWTLTTIEWIFIFIVG